MEGKLRSMSACMVEMIRRRWSTWHMSHKNEQVNIVKNFACS